MNIFMFKLTYIFIFVFVLNFFIILNESIANNDILTFSSIDLENNTIDSETYYEFILSFHSIMIIYMRPI